MILTAVGGMESRGKKDGGKAVRRLLWLLRCEVRSAEDMMLERGSPMRRRTGGWRVKQLHIVLLRARAFLSCSELFRCDQKCNKSTVRCELKTLTLLSLPSLKFLSYDTTRELENKICEDGL